MKRTLAILLMLMLSTVSRAFFIQTNVANIVIGSSSGANFDQAEFSSAGFDDQEFKLQFNYDLSGALCLFKVAQDVGKGQVAFISMTPDEITVSGTSVVWDVARTRIPPNGSYQAELWASDSLTNKARSIARFTWNITDSLYDDNDSTYPWPTNAADLSTYLTKNEAASQFLASVNIANKLEGSIWSNSAASGITTSNVALWNTTPTNPAVVNTINTNNIIKWNLAPTNGTSLNDIDATRKAAWDAGGSTAPVDTNSLILGITNNALAIAAESARATGAEGAIYMSMTNLMVLDGDTMPGPLTNTVSISTPEIIVLNSSNHGVNLHDTVISSVGVESDAPFRPYTNTCSESVLNGRFGQDGFSAPENPYDPTITYGRETEWYLCPYPVSRGTQAFSEVYFRFQDTSGLSLNWMFAQIPKTNVTQGYVCWPLPMSIYPGASPTCPRYGFALDVNSNVLFRRLYVGAPVGEDSDGAMLLERGNHISNANMSHTNYEGGIYGGYLGVTYDDNFLFQTNCAIRYYNNGGADRGRMEFLTGWGSLFTNMVLDAYGVHVPSDPGFYLGITNLSEVKLSQYDVTIAANLAAQTTADNLRLLKSGDTATSLRVSTVLTVPTNTVSGNTWVEQFTNGTFTGSAAGWTLGGSLGYDSGALSILAGLTGTASPTGSVTLVAGDRFAFSFVVPQGTATVSFAGYGRTATFTAATGSNDYFSTALNSASPTVSVTSISAATLDNFSLRRETSGELSAYHAAIGRGGLEVAGAIQSPTITSLVTNDAIEAAARAAGDALKLNTSTWAVADSTTNYWRRTGIDPIVSPLWITAQDIVPGDTGEYVVVTSDRVSFSTIGGARGIYYGPDEIIGIDESILYGSWDVQGVLYADGGIVGDVSGASNFPASKLVGNISTQAMTNAVALLGLGTGGGGSATNIGGYPVATITGASTDDRLALSADGKWTNVAAGAMTEYDKIAGVGVTNNAQNIINSGAGATSFTLRAWATASNANSQASAPNAAALTNTIPAGVLGTTIVRTVGGIITTGSVSSGTYLFTNSDALFVGKLGGTNGFGITHNGTNYWFLLSP